MKVAAVLPVVLCDRAVNPLAPHCAGRSVLDHLLARLARVDRLAATIVAATTGPSDDPVAEFCRARGIPCFRDDRAEDRLGLVLAAARSVGAGAALLVRYQAPLIDPAILQRVVDLVHLTDGMLDFVGTTLARAYPRGMEVEACLVAALEDADRRCADAELRSDAAAFLRQNSRLYRLLAVEAEADVARPEHGFALSSPADLANIVQILEHFDNRSDISLGELIAFAEGRT